MADRHNYSTSHQHQASRPPRSTAVGVTTTTQNGQPPFLRKLYEQAPNSAQFIGILTLIFSGGILLLLAGLIITTVVLGLIFFAPLLIISSPIWVPIGAVLFFLVAGLLFTCGFGITAFAATSWLYRYFRGLHPPGSDQFDYARSRIVDTAGHVKDYAREYGGYLHSKVKDAAPGA